MQTTATATMSPEDHPAASLPLTQTASLWSLFKSFVAIGSVAFGGFMALISVIENRMVKQRQLLEHKTMLDGIALANLLPGPQAVNVVAFLGYRLHGPIGALVCTVAVLLPTFCLMLVLSYLYFRFGEIPSLQKIFAGFIPAVAAIVLSVAWRMGKKTVTGSREVLLVIAAVLLILVTPVHYKVYATLAIVVLHGALGYRLFKSQQATHTETTLPQAFSKIKLIAVLGILALILALGFLPLPLPHDGMLFFLITIASMSLMLFGGGYVFIPMIGSVVVLQYHWVSQQEFTDAIAMGQITPGPILVSMTFIGYKLFSWWGALLATIAIYTPPAVLMVVASQGLDVIQRSSGIRAAMHGIHCGVVGMIAIAALVLLQATLPAGGFSFATAWPALLILAAALVALIRFNIDVVWIIPPAGLLGYLLF